MSSQVHPTAVVAADASLGDGVTVDAYATVGSRVTLGAECKVGAHAHVEGPSTFGAGNNIYPHAVLGTDPQDLKFDGEETFLEVGDRNSFREFCTVHRGTASGGGVTRVGSDNLFMAYSHIAHDCVVGSRTVFANSGTLAGHVVVHDDAVVGAFSSVHQGCRVGRHAYIGGYTVLTQDALPFAKTVGQKALCYGLNRIGLERKGFSKERLRVLERALRLLTRKGLSVPKAVDAIRGELEGDDVEYLVEFIESSARGVARALPGRRGGRSA